MGNRRIALVEPSSGIPGFSTFAGHNEYEPIGLEYIASVLEESGYETQIFRQSNNSPSEIVDVVAAYEPWVVGFSVMTHAANSAIQISALLKKNNCKLIIVAGGYHPTGHVEYIYNESIDFVIVGEGEKTFLNLLTGLEKKQDISGLAGIRYLRNGQIVNNGLPTRIDPIDKIPFPKRDISILSSAKMHGLMSPAESEQHNVAVVLGSRGCPHNCAFCCSRSLWGQKVIARTATDIVDEIDSLVKKYKTNAIFFSDLTFNFSKKRVLELCAALTQYGRTPSWYAMCTASNLQDDVIYSMHEAGCRKIGFGVESLSEASLESVNKTFNDSNEFNGILNGCDRTGILTKAYLIIGYPWETFQSLEEAQRVIINLPVDEIRISFFTPFPGSPAYDRCKETLTKTDWSYFNAIKDIVVSNSAGIPDNVLKETRKAIFKAFYNNPEYWDRVSNKIGKFPYLHRPFGEFKEFLKKSGVHDCFDK